MRAFLFSRFGNRVVHDVDPPIDARRPRRRLEWQVGFLDDGGEIGRARVGAANVGGSSGNLISKRGA